MDQSFEEWCKANGKESFTGEAYTTRTNGDGKVISVDRVHLSPTNEATYRQNWADYLAAKETIPIPARRMLQMMNDATEKAVQLNSKKE